VILIEGCFRADYLSETLVSPDTGILIPPLSASPSARLAVSRESQFHKNAGL